MRQQGQLRSVSNKGFIWVISCACGAMPPAERAPAESAHTFAVRHGEALEREVGAGGGPHVRTLASLAKCPNIINTARRLTERKGTIYPAANAELAADRIMAVLAGDAELGCSAVGKGAGDEKPGATANKHGQAPAKNAAERANMKEQYGE